MTTISSFSGEYRFLSNFYPAIVILDGSEYPTVEHAYQAAKTTDLIKREEIRLATSPGKAKRLGQKVKLRNGWEQMKVRYMEELVKQKFNNPEMRKLLLSTSPAELVEGNTWGDTFWGICRGVGQNRLGRILMDIRFNFRGTW